MEIDSIVCMDLESEMRYRNESQMKDETEEEPPRQSAGFEWAAEPDEMLFPCCATKFVMLGIAATLVVSDVADISENNRRIRSRLTCAIIFGTIEFFLAICVCILMFRMLYYYYQNRGEENVVAVCA
ncbi:unnamed protein product [Caenorhabditis nigoni]